MMETFTVSCLDPAWVTAYEQPGRRSSEVPSQDRPGPPWMNGGLRDGQSSLSHHPRSLHPSSGPA